MVGGGVVTMGHLYIGHTKNSCNSFFSLLSESSLWHSPLLYDGRRGTIKVRRDSSMTPRTRNSARAAKLVPSSNDCFIS